jgi:hypothetical protein
MKRCAICEHLPGHEHVCPEANLWQNTRTGEWFQVTAQPGRPWSLPDRPTAENMAKVTEPFPGEAIRARP